MEKKTDDVQGSLCDQEPAGRFMPWPKESSDEKDHGTQRRRIIMVSVVFLNDTLTTQTATGAAIAICGVFLSSCAKRKYRGGTRTLLSNRSKRRPKRKHVPILVMLVAYFLLHSYVAQFYPLFDIETAPPSEPTKQQQQQQLVHLLRANDMGLDEIVHVFDRTDELHEIIYPQVPPVVTKQSIAETTGKVLCSVGLRQEQLIKLGHVWVQALGGTIGHTVSDHSLPASANDFSHCDVVVSSGGTYECVSRWAFRSSIPVINLWNTDNYHPQNALLFAYQLARDKKRSLSGYSTDILSKTRAYFSSFGIKEKLPPKISMNFLGPSQLLALAEVSYLFQFKLLPCPTSDKECYAKNKIHPGPIQTGRSAALLAAMAEFALAKSGDLPNSYTFPGIRCEPSGVIVSGKVNGHDPNFVYGKGGNVLFALEWERVTRIKHSTNHGFERAAEVGAKYAKSEFNVSDISLFVLTRSAEVKEVGVVSEVGGSSESSGEKFIKHIFEGVPVIYKEQNFAHTIHAFFDSPFERALVLAIHGGGSEPYSAAIYLARRGMHPILLKVCDNRFMIMGQKYMLASMTFPEVRGERDAPMAVLSWSGIFMGYSALGKPLPCIEKIEELLLRTPPGNHFWDPLFLIQKHCSTSWNTSSTTDATKDFPKNLPVETQRDIACTFQELFERSFLHILSEVKEDLQGIDGIVLAGGSALNVKATQRVREEFNKPVWVPSAPADNGLGVGGIWSVCQPPRHTTPLQYHGLPLLDEENLPQRAKAWGAEYLGMDEEAAIRLAKLMAVEKRIIAVVIGNQEYGPRALSHRSLMAYPESIEIRERMNALKFRQFYRPTCPTIAEEFVGDVFVKPENVNSPFMSFAPKLQDWVKKDLPAIRHFDGTARPQTLSKSQEPFIHSMLMSIPKVRNDGKPIVINTSFNIKGQPIINTVQDTLHMLCDRPQLDYVFVDGYLFELQGNATHKGCRWTSHKSYFSVNSLANAQK